MIEYEIDKKLNLLKVRSKKNKDRKVKTDNLLIAKYFNIGYYLITPILLGVFFGLYLDDKFKTNGKIILLSICIGSISSLYNLYKIAQKKY